MNKKAAWAPKFSLTLRHRLGLSRAQHRRKVSPLRGYFFSPLSPRTKRFTGHRRLPHPEEIRKAPATGEPGASGPIPFSPRPRQGQIKFSHFSALLAPRRPFAKVDPRDWSWLTISGLLLLRRLFGRAPPARPEQSAHAGVNRGDEIRPIQFVR